MEKVEPVRDVDLLILSFDPGELVDYLIAPFVHALIAYVHLGVQDPEEAKAFLGKDLHGDVHDLCIRHCRVVQIELVVREHEARVVSLCPLYPPGGVDQNHFEMTQLVNNILQIEEPQIAIYEGF